MAENRPKLLILGYGRHGKDTVAEILRDQYGLRFKSSSEFVGEECLWNQWGKAVYPTFEAMFEDRHNHRELWMQMISAYNTPDKTRTASTMFERGFDMYVGMRRQDELDACKAAGIFDKIIWIQRPGFPEETGSMDITPESAGMDYMIMNDGDIRCLEERVSHLVHDLITKEGFNWRLPEQLEIIIQPDIKPQAVEEVDLMDTPDDAIQVLDHGYVALVDVMGTDDDIAEAARLSYGRGTKKTRDNSGLIRYLYSHAHTSPFEMVEMKFQMRLPIFVMRQWVRHRTSNLNEYSGRYSVMPRMWYTPEPEQIMGQDTVNKQGSSGSLQPIVQETVQRMIWEQANQCFNTYEEMLAMGVSREMARIVLPLNTYTEIMWKMDLNNMLKFLWLRDDSHAQPEIQAFAKVIAQMVEDNFPKTYAAYKESRESVTLSKRELLAIITGDRTALSKSEAAKSENLQRDLQEWIRTEIVK